MERGIFPNPYEITEEDFREHRRVDNFGGSFGFVQKCDIGRRVFLQGGVISMESDTQVLERRERQKKLPIDVKVRWAE
jgi:hypothetical protein